MRKSIIVLALVMTLLMPTGVAMAHTKLSTNGFPKMSKQMISVEVEQALIESNIAPRERAYAHYIWRHESVRNLGVSKNRIYYGIWQLKRDISKKVAWYDPHLSTHRAIKYMLGRYHSITAAYRHKRRYGWY